MINTGKIQYLEGIRGVAAFMVFFHHFFLAFYPAYYLAGDPAISHLGNVELNYWRSPLSFITNGEFMVCIFFVLSGYVLSKAYVETNDSGLLVSASVRRFFRLYIPLAAALIIAYVVLRCNFSLIAQCTPITQSQWLVEIAPADKSFSTFFKFLTYNTIFLRDNRYITSTWTLSIELYGSLMVFAALALSHKLRKKWIFFIITGLIAYYFFSEYYVGFMIGICLHYFERVNNRTLKFRSLWVTLLLISGIILGGFPTYPWNTERMTFYKSLTWAIVVNNFTTVHIIGATFIIMAALISTTFQKIFSNRFFIFLGDISFSAYLLHPIVVTTVSLATFLNIYKTTGNYNISVMVSLFASLAVIVIAANIMTVFIDKPGIRFSKYIYNRFFKANT